MSAQSCSKSQTSTHPPVKPKETTNQSKRHGWEPEALAPAFVRLQGHAPRIEITTEATQTGSVSVREPSPKAKTNPSLGKAESKSQSAQADTIWFGCGYSFWNMWVAAPRKFLAWMCVGFLWMGSLFWTSGDDSITRGAGFQFDTKISRSVLENYLSRSICVEGLLNGKGHLEDDTRMLTNCSAKYIARALCLWGAENDFIENLRRAKVAVSKVLAADPEMVLEACFFEVVGTKVSEIAIPDCVFKALGQPVEQRNFRFEEMIYPEGQRRSMGLGQEK